MDVQANGFSQNRKGQATVEFALVLPLSLLLLFAIIDLSMYFYYEGAMSHVCRTVLRNSVTNQRYADDSTTNTDDLLSRLDTAKKLAQDTAPPLLDIITDGGNANIFFLDVTDPANVGTNLDDLGGSQVKLMAVLRQDVRFITPLNRLLGWDDNRIGDKVTSDYLPDSTAYNMQVSTIFTVQNLAAEEEK